MTFSSLLCCCISLLLFPAASGAFTAAAAPLARSLALSPVPGSSDSSSGCLNGHNIAAIRPPEKEEGADDDTALRLRLLDMLRRMTGYFGSMVDDTDTSSSRRFYALSRPPTGERLHMHCPMRDLGAAWDATTALLFWTKEQQSQTFTDEQHCTRRLQGGVLGTLQFYNASYIPVKGDVLAGSSDGAVALDPAILREPPHVAHSALMLLASVGALRLFRSLEDNANNAAPPPVQALTRGILSRQRSDGAFCVEFGSEDIYQMVAFYPGEAMVALMEVYDAAFSGTTTTTTTTTTTMPGILLLDDATRTAIIPAMQRAFLFYSDFYHQNGDLDANYNTWQVQAFARLFLALHDSDQQQHDDDNNENNEQQCAAVADYVLELCRDIVHSRSWRELGRGASFYPNLNTVEIACGLDAVVQGLRVASAPIVKKNNDRDAEEETRLLLGMHARNAVEFLKWAQDRVPPEAEVGSGGLGYGGIQVLEQRLDVTGHAIAALTKLFQFKKDIGATPHSK